MAEQMELANGFHGQSVGSLVPARGSVWTLEPFKAAFLFGVPLFGVLYAGAKFSPVGGETLNRYLSHPVEMVELALFCLGLGAYLGRMLGLRQERAALAEVPLAQAAPGSADPAQAGDLARQLRSQPAAWRESFVGRRLAGALDFVHRRKSAQDLDDQLRQLADTDAMALEGSYALTRFITWAIPILGFFGNRIGYHRRHRGCDTRGAGGIAEQRDRRPGAGV